MTLDAPNNPLPFVGRSKKQGALPKKIFIFEKEGAFPGNSAGGSKKASPGALPEKLRLPEGVEGQAGALLPSRR